jgi:hypothetical protein
MSLACAKPLCCEKEILVGLVRELRANYLPNSSNAVGVLYRAPKTLEAATVIGMVYSEKVSSVGLCLVGDIESSLFLGEPLHRRQLYCRLRTELFF